MLLTAVSGDLHLHVTDVLNADYEVSRYQVGAITVQLELAVSKTGEATVNIQGTPETLELLAVHLSNQATAGRMALLSPVLNDNDNFEDGEDW